MEGSEGPRVVYVKSGFYSGYCPELVNKHLVGNLRIPRGDDLALNWQDQRCELFEIFGQIYHEVSGRSMPSAISVRSRTCGSYGRPGARPRQIFRLIRTATSSELQRVRR